MDEAERRKAIQRMQEYIEEHIDEPITLRMLAHAAGYSPWHAERVFKELTGKTPFEYLRAVRLSRAAARLRDTDARIVDVAFDSVFGSHEGFTRAFSRHFGMTPRQFRANAPLTRSLLPGGARGSHLTPERGVRIMPQRLNTVFVRVMGRPGGAAPTLGYLEYADTIFVQVVDRSARKLILKWGTKATHYYEYYDEVIRDIEEERRWSAAFANIKEALSETVGLWLPENLRKPGTSTYNLGVEVPADYAGEVPAGFEIIDLPPCKMMFFQGPPCEGEPLRDPVQHAIDTYDPKPYGFGWADQDGPRFQLAPMGYRGYIEARPVRPLRN